MEDEVLNIPNTPWQFSTTAIDNLGASEYTLVTIACDKSGSVSGFEAELIKALNTVIDSCRKSPRAENILIRTVAFNHSQDELHGFNELAKIKDYTQLDCEGATALFDSVYASLGATIEYSKKLRSMDYSVNAIMFILTDGEDNRSTYGASEIKKLVDQTLHSEEIGSVITILVGINDNGGLNSYLTNFKNNANLTQYVSLGDATAQRMAKLAGFVSQSISSQSKSLASGTVANTSQLVF